MATVQRIDASVSAAAPVPPDPQPSTAARRYTPGIGVTTFEPCLLPGVAPGFSTALYILFSRFLS